MLNETGISDIADKQVMIRDLIQEKYNFSIPYQIGEIVPLKSTWGRYYTSKENNGKMEIVKKDLNAVTRKYNTGFTKEAYEDILAMYEKSAKTLIQSVIKGASAREENETFMSLVDSESIFDPEPLILTDINNAETITFELSLKVSRIAINMNRFGYHTLHSFCILPPKYAASVMAIYSAFTEGTEKSYYVGTMSNTRYYVNPLSIDSARFNSAFDNEFYSDDGDEYGYVGLYSSSPGHSSIIMAPYYYQVQSVIDPDTGHTSYFTYNSYDIAVNPLHSPIEKKAMLTKFKIEIK
jgi:hypothetical protein